MSKLLIAVLAALVGTTLCFSEETKQVKKDNVVVLSSSNTLVLNSQVDGNSVGELLLKSRQLNSSSPFSLINDNKAEPIYLFLNTPGGEIQAGLELIEGLKGSDRKINTVTLFAASMGFQIAQSLGDRLILDKGTLMSHRAAGGFQGSFGGQKPSQVDSRYNYWLTRLQEMDQQTVNRTKGKQTLASYQAAYADEMWRTGQQSVAEGYADKVVTLKCDDSLNGVSTHEINFMGLQISYDLDNCPINTSPMNIKIQLPVTSKSPGLKPVHMELNKFISLNGGFGPSCLYSNVYDLCASDPSVTLKDIKSIQEQFEDTMVNKKDHVVRMKF